MKGVHGDGSYYMVCSGKPESGLYYFLGIMPRDDGNGLEEEENFEEALRAANTALEHTR